MRKYEKMMINLVDGLDKHLEPEKKILLLEECGRKCIRDKGERFIQNANELYKKSNDVMDFFEKFSKVYDSLHVTDDEVAVIYPKCLCPIINKIPSEKISSSYCNCSRGWVKELFESATEKPVEVILDESITKGNTRCKLRVIIEK